jgi:hypothetical protein
MLDKRTTVLLGNGPNRLSDSSISWNDVLDLIMKETPYLLEVSDGKPFPLLFEEIAIHNLRNQTGNDIDLKQSIAKKVATIAPNFFHHRLLQIGCKNILTTNYDYALEKAAVDQGFLISNINNSEAINSLFRSSHLKSGSTIWHIHGDCDIPRSILLGYGHYVSYLSELYKYTHSPKKPNYWSWIDIFLRDNVFIVGLGLGFEEIDLWWAITLKERRRNKAPDKIGRTYYYQFSIDGKIDAKCRSLLDLGVEVILVEIDGIRDYPKGYFRILMDIRSLGSKRQSRKNKWTHLKKPSASWLA